MSAHHPPILGGTMLSLQIWPLLELFSAIQNKILEVGYSTSFSNAKVLIGESGRLSLDAAAHYTFPFAKANGELILQLRALFGIYGNEAVMARKKKKLESQLTDGPANLPARFSNNERLGTESPGIFDVKHTFKTFDGTVFVILSADQASLESLSPCEFLAMLLSENRGLSWASFNRANITEVIGGTLRHFQPQTDRISPTFDFDSPDGKVLPYPCLQDFRSLLISTLFKACERLATHRDSLEVSSAWCTCSKSCRATARCGDFGLQSWRYFI